MHLPKKNYSQLGTFLYFYLPKIILFIKFNRFLGIMNVKRIRLRCNCGTVSQLHLAVGYTWIGGVH